MPQNNMLKGMETFLTLSRLFRNRPLCGSSDPLSNLVPCPGMPYLKIRKFRKDQVHAHMGFHMHR
jgi:hypothetical protein